MAIHTEDLEYLRPQANAPLLACYYRPEGTGPFPAVLEVRRRMPRWLLPSSAGRWPIPSPAIARCAIAAMNV